MKLSPTLASKLSGLISFNAGTNAAMPQDMYDFLVFAVEEQHLKPQIVVVGLDMEMLDNGERPTAHLPSLVARAVSLISWEETRLSARSLRLWAGKDYPPPTRVIDKDGYLHERILEAEEKRGINSLDQGFDVFFANYKNMWESFTAISPKQLAIFARLLQYCDSHNIKVVVFYTPYHPRLEAALEQESFSVRKREFLKSVDNVCSLAHVPCYDFTSPKNFNGDSADFYDGVHVREHNAELILQRILPLRNALQ